LSGLIQLAKRPEIRTEPGKVKHQVVKAAMRQRGETLAARALEVWASPQLSEEQRQV